MEREEKNIQLNLPLTEQVVFVPDEMVRQYEQTIRMMEASLNDFIIVAKNLKPINH